MFDTATNQLSLLAEPGRPRPELIRIPFFYCASTPKAHGPAVGFLLQAKRI
ncbi:MAG TPA: hypothetical protein VGG19_02775 [Tepidisphaeraceae bacterium]